MQIDIGQGFSVETEKTVLSSECRIYKTERFIKETRRFAGVDFFISKIAGGIIRNFEAIISLSEYADGAIDCFRVSTKDGEHAFCFKLGSQIDTNLSIKNKDIIFFKYLDKEQHDRKNDQRFVNYLKAKKTFEITVDLIKDLTAKSDFKKLYGLSYSDTVNFPLLNAEQDRIVSTEDQNILVQGVAGSGKTNICVSKIVFTACRAYYGRILYTTFSRGLLLDTKSKIDTFTENLKTFVRDYENGNIVFADSDKKKATEIRLGIYLPSSEPEKFISKIKEIIAFLETRVDYFLIEDLFKKYIDKDAVAASENYFVKEYVKNIKNHQLAGKLNRVSHLSYEVIFKEIYGMITGCYDLSAPKSMLTLDEYTEKRKDSFNKSECEVIHSLAYDYALHLKKNKLTDNNLMSRKLLEIAGTIEKYSLAVIDEVQDFTEVNLCLFKSISRKLFCVGDALQMINPSYFGFAYLKRLLYEKDVVSVAELSHNYRSTRRIAGIIDNLGKINISRFGTHSFVLKGESVDSEINTTAVYVKDKNFLDAVAKENFENFTIIVSSVREKEELRRILKRQEILTVAEIKGLERDTIVLYDILSSNADKWNTLERVLINRKVADENSVYRYYFNLFYVGVSRAKAHLYVAEHKDIPAFKDFFEKYFDIMDARQAVDSLTGVVSRIETDQEELSERVTQFINLGQYDNARFAANKIKDDVERTRLLNRISVNEEYISRGKYREAGIKYWEYGMIEDAKRQFSLSGDKILTELIDACTEKENSALSIDILDFLLDVQNNDAARKFIIETVKNDLKKLNDAQKAVNGMFKSIKEKRNG